MAFDAKSRYVNLTTYTTTDLRGRTVEVVPVPDAPVQDLAGRHLRKQIDRTDHLANFYLGDPAGYWRICEINDVMLPEALSEAIQVNIPVKKG